MTNTRLPLWLILSTVTTVAVAGCASQDPVDATVDLGDVTADSGDTTPNDSSGWFLSFDGKDQFSTCTAPRLDRPPPCGVVDGQPFYAFYDGCNWCTCHEGGPVCTQRGCPPGEPVSFFFLESLPGTPALAETWVCDEGGRLFRSACLPEGDTIDCAEVTNPPQLQWRNP